MSEITSSEMIEKATRMKMRWMFRGPSSVEQLWDGDEDELKALYKSLRSVARLNEEETPWDTPSRENDMLALQIGIVKHIIDVKLAEKLARKEASERHAHKAKLLKIAEFKQDEELRGKPLEELQRLINELE